ncbi:O-antigen ligase family protein [Polaromonas sp. P1(28)-8]|nr:O-antigen ligase family protein [Polaromonas sp. P1(28)-8]
MTLLQSNLEISRTNLIKQTANVRLAVICLAAASVGLSMAVISISKLLLFIFAAATLLFFERRSVGSPALARTYTPTAVLVVLLAFTISLFWTTAPSADAMGSIAKYGKLLLIVLMMALIQDRREAMYALGAFVLAQLFLMLSSWMLFIHLPVPWATSRMALKEFAVFSSYLDQGIIGAVLAAICWHLRHLAPGRFGPHFMVLAALAYLCNVLFVLNGRSGHLVAIAMLSLAIMWELPKRYRAAVVLLPFVLVGALFLSSHKVRDRLIMMKMEVESHSAHAQPNTSSGLRLHFWMNSIQMIARHPVAGSGVGSWSTEYNRIQRDLDPAHKDIAGNFNPHQEFLLWAVQLGIPGLLLLCGLMLAMIRDSWTMEKPYARVVQSTVVALAVACLFNASIYDALIGDFFAVTLGLLLALGLTANASKPSAMSAQPGAI